MKVFLVFEKFPDNHNFTRVNAVYSTVEGATKLLLTLKNRIEKDTPRYKCWIEEMNVI